MPRVEIVACGYPNENRQPMIQAALDAVAKAGGGEVFLPDGEYIIGPGDGMEPPIPVPPSPANDGLYSLRIGDNTHLRMGPGTTLIRRSKGGGGDATILNAGIPTGTTNTNIKVTGGTIKTVNSANTGRHLLFYRCSGVQVRDTRITEIYGDWNASFGDCTDVTVSGLYINSGTTTGEDGLHFVGGSRIAVDNCVITSGDDAMSLTQEGANETDMTDVVISNCTLVSRKANALRIWAHTAQAKKIARVRVANCVGKTGLSGAISGLGIVIEDDQNLKRITDVDVDGFTQDSVHNGAEAFKIYGVARVRMRGVVSREPLVGGLVDASNDVELVDCAVESPRDNLGFGKCLWVAATADCQDVRILGGRYTGGKSNGIVLGKAAPGPAQAIRPQVAGARISGVTGVGIQVVLASQGLLSGNYITGCSSNAIDEAVGSQDNSYIANHLYGNGGATGPILLQGLRAHAIRNVTTPGQPIADTGGFRQTIDGWSRPSHTGGGGFIMDRAIGRFRAPRGGSLTGIAVNVDNPWTAGTLQVSVLKNTGNAGAVGSPMALVAVINNLTVPPNKAFVTQPQDVSGCAFNAGDELFLGINYIGWNVGGLASAVYAAIEIET